MELPMNIFKSNLKVYIESKLILTYLSGALASLPQHNSFWYPASNCPTNFLNFLHHGSLFHEWN